MTENEMQGAIESFLKAQWAAKSPISWDNVSYESVDNTPYIEPIISTVDSQTLSKDCIRTTCLLTVVIRVPKGTGDKIASEFSHELLRLFVNESIQGITFKNGYSERIGNLKEWHQKRVLITFFYNLTF